MVASVQEAARAAVWAPLEGPGRAEMALRVVALASFAGMVARLGLGHLEESRAVRTAQFALGLGEIID